MTSGEYGVALSITTGKDLTGIVSATLHRVSPAGVVSTITLTDDVSNPGAGMFTHTTAVGEWDEPGAWSIMLDVEFSGSQRLKSAVTPLIVDAGL